MVEVMWCVGVVFVVCSSCGVCLVGICFCVVLFYFFKFLELGLS